MTPLVVRIAWVDAGHRRDWGTAEEVADWAEDDEKFTVKTAGHLVGEHEDWLLIAPSFTEEGNIHSPIRIMRANIISMEVLDGNEETESD
jgi:hypothetical protein